MSARGFLNEMAPVPQSLLHREFSMVETSNNGQTVFNLYVSFNFSFIISCNFSFIRPHKLNYQFLIFLYSKQQCRSADFYFIFY